MKKIIIILSIAFVLSILISSCVSTETTSFVDPSFKGKKFQKICVLADFNDLKYKQKLEREFLEIFKDNNINAVSGTQLFPPTREWTQEQMQDILVKDAVDGYLLVSWKDKNIHDTYKPGQAITETKGEVKKKDGKDVYTEKTVTSHTSGTVEREFKSFFEAKLIDINSKNNAWIATSYSSSGEWFGSDYDLIMESYAKDIVKKLKEDGLIK